MGVEVVVYADAMFMKVLDLGFYFVCRDCFFEAVIVVWALNDSAIGWEGHAL